MWDLTGEVEVIFDQTGVGGKTSCVLFLSVIYMKCVLWWQITRVSCEMTQYSPLHSCWAVWVECWSAPCGQDTRPAFQQRETRWWFVPLVEWAGCQWTLHRSISNKTEAAREVVQVRECPGINTKANSFVPVDFHRRFDKSVWEQCVLVIKRVKVSAAMWTHSNLS